MYLLQNSRFLSLVKLCLSGDLLIALYKKTFYVMDTFAVMISTIPVSTEIVQFPILCDSRHVTCFVKKTLQNGS
jgi:hypothetical protein